MKDVAPSSVMVLVSSSYANPLPHLAFVLIDDLGFK